MLQQCQMVCMPMHACDAVAGYSELVTLMFVPTNIPLLQCCSTQQQLMQDNCQKLLCMTSTGVDHKRLQAKQPCSISNNEL